MVPVTQTIKVETRSHPYTVKIIFQGLRHLETHISRVWSKRQIVIITDEHVGPLYAQQACAHLSAAGYPTKVLTIPAGEQSKSWSQLEKVVNQLAAWHLSRTDGIIALGGGVVGDLAGFAASIYLRGIAVIQVPTSLLAQVDSSVGGKTAIDLPAGKNLVGTFYQPDFVLIDPAVLQTLPQRLLAEGYGEILKCAIMAGSDFWNLTAHIQSCTALLQAAPQLISASVSFKTAVVTADETETQQRQLLNLGHTVGHAVEIAAAGRLFHGEAVAIGLYQLTRLFEKKQLTPNGTSTLLAQRLQALGLPLADPALETPAFYQALQHDKKLKQQQLTLIYLKKIGQPAFYELPLAEAMTWFKHELPQRSH